MTSHQLIFSLFLKKRLIHPVFGLLMSAALFVYFLEFNYDFFWYPVFGLMSFYFISIYFYILCSRIEGQKNSVNGLRIDGNYIRFGLIHYIVSCTIFGLLAYAVYVGASYIGSKTGLSLSDSSVGALLSQYSIGTQYFRLSLLDVIIWLMISSLPFFISSAFLHATTEYGIINFKNLVKKSTNLDIDYYYALSTNTLTKIEFIGVDVTSRKVLICSSTGVAPGVRLISFDDLYEWFSYAPGVEYNSIVAGGNLAVAAGVALSNAIDDAQRGAEARDKTGLYLVMNDARSTTLFVKMRLEHASNWVRLLNKISENRVGTTSQPTLIA